MFIRKQISKIIILSLLWQQIFIPVAYAANISVDQAKGQNTSLDNAQNGVPIVNIATPKSGVSANYYHDYNVGEQGLILNNSKNIGNSQLGGTLSFNPNFSENGVEADIILNEVTSTNQSFLNGYTEVFGKQAELIIANPNGITCQGCGFINTSRLSLILGKSNQDGSVDKFTLTPYQRQGSAIPKIKIISKSGTEYIGLDGSETENIDIIGGAIEIAGVIYGKNKVSIKSGDKEYDYATKQVTSDINKNSETTISIDGKQVGAIYAGQIEIIGTKEGIGVKMDSELMASGGDITLNANGDISYKTLAATGNIKVKTTKNIEQKQVAVSDGNIELKADGDIKLRGDYIAARNELKIEAGKNIDIRPKDIPSSSDRFYVNASKNVIEAGNNIYITQTQIQSKTSNDIKANKQIYLINSDVISNNYINIASIDTNIANVNIISKYNNVAISGYDNLDINTGNIYGGSNVNINPSKVGLVQNSKLYAGDNININAYYDTSKLAISNSLIVAEDNFALNSKGDVAIKNYSIIQATTGYINASIKNFILDNNSNLLAANSNIIVNASEAISSQTKSNILTNTGVISLVSRNITNEDSLIYNRDNFTVISASNIINNKSSAKIKSEKGNILLSATEKLENSDGSIIEKEQATGVNSQNYDGIKIVSKDIINKNSSDIVNKQTDIILQGNNLTNQNNSQIIAENRDIKFNLTQSVNNLDNSTIYTSEDIIIGSETAKLNVIQNKDGSKLLTEKGVAIFADDINNDAGLILASNEINLDSTNSLSNNNGQIVTVDDINIKAKTIENKSGKIITENNINITDARGEKLDNTGGLIKAGKNVQINLNDELINDQGEITSLTEVALKVKNKVKNSFGYIFGKDKVEIEAKEIINDNTLTISSGIRQKTKGIISENQVIIKEVDKLNNSNSGYIYAKNKVDLKNVINNAGTIESAEIINIENDVITNFDNRGGQLLITNSNHITVTTNGQLLNSGGKILSDKDIFITAGNTSLDGEIDAKETITLNTGSITNNASIDAGINLTLNANGNLINNNHIAAKNNLHLNLTGNLTNTGKIGADNIDIDANVITNNNQIMADVSLDIDARSTITNSGNAEIGSFGNSDVKTTGGSILNSGQIGASGSLTLNASGDIKNIYTEDLRLGLVSGGNMNLTAGGSVENHKSTIYSGGSLTITASILKNGLLDKASENPNPFGTVASTGEFPAILDFGRNQTQVVTSLEEKLLEINDIRVVDSATDLAVIEARGNITINATVNNIGYDKWEGELYTVVKEDFAESGGYTDKETTGVEYTIPKVKTDVAVIRSNGSINITGNTTNHGGWIMASSNISISGGLENKVSTFIADEAAVEAATGVDHAPTKTYYHKKWEHCYKITLGLICKDKHANWDETYSRELTTLTPSLIKAGGSISVSATGNEVEDFAKVNGGISVGSSSPTLSTVAINIQAAQLSGVVDLTAFIPKTSGTNGLFKVNSVANPTLNNQNIKYIGAGSAISLNTNLSQTYAVTTSNYLIETNSKYIDRSEFIGSDYFLNRIGIDAKTVLRLGDPLVENRIITSAIEQLSPTKFLLEGVRSDTEQVKRLYDNAIAMKEELNLAPGISLSAKQVARLSQDMIWLEGVEIDGKKVLAPRLYLSSATRAKLTENGDITIAAGENIDIATNGIIKNESKIYAGNNMNLNAGTIANLGGSLTSGNDMTLVASNGSIISSSLKETSGGGDNKSEFIARKSTIKSGGKLTAESSKDINIASTKVTAEDDISLNAGGNITVTGTALNNKMKSESKTGSAEHDYTTYAKSSLTSEDGNISISGNNINIAGTKLTGKSGNITSRGNINITDLIDKRYDRNISKTENIIRKKTTDTGSYKETSIASELKFLNSLTLNSGSETLLRSAKITSNNITYNGTNLSSSQLLASTNNTNTLPSGLTITTSDLINESWHNVTREYNQATMAVIAIGATIATGGAAPLQEEC